MSDGLRMAPPRQGGTLRATYRATRPGIDQGTKRLLGVTAGLGLLLVAGMGGWMVMGRTPAVVPVIEPDTRPLRVRPANPGGMQVVGADESVSGDRSAVQAMAPAPEAPAPQALRAQAMPPAPVVVAPVEPPAPPALPAVTAPRAAPAPASASTSAPASAPAPAPTATPAPVPAQVAQATPPLPRIIIGSPPPSAGPAPAPRGPAPSAQTTPATRTERPAQGAAMVQLAAVDSEAGAQAEWQRLTRKMPDLFGDRQLMAVRAEREGKTFWRVRTGGFADVAEATAFCARVKEKGNACALAF